MPLYKRKEFPLAGVPKDLKPNEHVFQVRFTKEIFRDYGEYLKRVNLYRERVWRCKVTGKSNLTYEEALVSEKKATEKVQQFPKELVAPVLRDVQYSMLTLKDLVNLIVMRLQCPLSEGSEVYGRKHDRVYPCRIVKVLEEGDKTHYEVVWLDKDNKVTGNALVSEEHLIKKKVPVSRSFLKSFIRESTYRSVPWVLHDNLAKNHGISVDPPEGLKGKIVIQDGRVLSCRKRKETEYKQRTGESNENGFREQKRKKSGKGKDESLKIVHGADEENNKPKEQPVKYPIDDLLVQATDDDKRLTERPSPSRDFNVPLDCVGDLLMVWDFCTSFGRLLQLSPFSLEDFENALCHKDSTVVLLVESHSALLRLLLKDGGEYSETVQKKKRKQKITIITWMDYLCDFLETSVIGELSSHVTTIKRGHYGLLDVRVKLGILRELVAQAIETDLFREKLDEYIEERRALGATKREEALEEGRKRREGKEIMKMASIKEEREVQSMDSAESNQARSVDRNYRAQNGNVSEKRNNKVHPLEQKNLLENSHGNEQGDVKLKKNAKKQKTDVKDASEDMNDSSRKGVQKLLKDDIKEAMGKKSKEQRKEYLEREMEKRFIRTNPLGKDRSYNRYWFFRRDGRIFVESSDSQWGYYCAKEEIDALIGSLNVKGERERALKKQLEKFYNKICLELQKKSKEQAVRIAMEEAVVRRSTRVRAPPRENPAVAFLKYVNKWKE